MIPTDTKTDTTPLPGDIHQLDLNFRRAARALEVEHARIGRISDTKTMRHGLDKVLQFLKSRSYVSRERNIAVAKIQEAIMWLGMDLKVLGEANPYPSSYDPSSPVVEKTADGLKL